MVHVAPMLSRVRNHFQGAKFARMSSGTYCIIRDLGLVKGGKGRPHHEVLVTFSISAFGRWLLGAARHALRSRTIAPESDASRRLRRVWRHHRRRYHRCAACHASSRPLSERHGHRRHVAGHAEQDDAGEQVAERNARADNSTQYTQPVDAFPDSAHYRQGHLHRQAEPHAGEDIGAGGRQRDLEDHGEPRHLQRPRHFIEPRLDRGEAVDGREMIGQIAPNEITNSAIDCDRPSMAIATGMIAETGSGRRNSSDGAT